MKLLITGGSGYLGGRLAQYFAENTNDEVIIGTRQSSMNNSMLPDIRRVVTTWDSPEELQKICKGVDAIIHLAGMNAADSANNPAGALQLSAVATGRLVNAAIKQGVKRFIFFSTAHVYKSPLTGRISEETAPENLHPYATSHRAAEDVVRFADQQGQIEGIIVRLSNAFGAPVNKEANCWMLFVNDLCKQAVITKQMKLTSTGLQHRNFITITDVCLVIRHLLSVQLTQRGNNIFNTGSSWSPAIWEMALIIQQESEIELGYQPTLSRNQPADDETSESLDFRIDKLLHTGFKPGEHIKEEIRQLLRFCKENFSSLPA